MGEKSVQSMTIDEIKYAKGELLLMVESRKLWTLKLKL